jgi:hypothetical protein
MVKSKEDLKIELGEAADFLKRVKENSSSTYRELLDTNINFYWEIVGRESGRYLLESIRNTNNSYLEKADPKYLFQNFGYLMHPNKREILRRTSNPYRTFLLLLKELFYPDFKNQESRSNPLELEKIAEQLTQLNIIILEGFKDSDDITDQHTYRVLVEIPETTTIPDLHGAIQDIKLITELVKPSHVFALVSPFFSDSFSFDADSDTLFFFTGGSVNPFDSYSSRQEVSRLKFPGAVSPIYNIQKTEDVSIQVTGSNTTFQMVFVPTYENATTNTLATTIGSASAKVNGIPVTIASVNGASGQVTLTTAPPLNSVVQITYYYNNTNIINTENLTNQADGVNTRFFVSRFPITTGVSSITPTTSPADVSVEINGVPAATWPFVYTVDGENGYIEFTTLPFVPNRAAGDTVSITYYYNSTYDYTGHPTVSPQIRENLLAKSIQVTETFNIAAPSSSLTLADTPTDIDGNPYNDITILVNVPSNSSLEDIIEDDDNTPGYLLEPNSTPPGYVVTGTSVTSITPSLEMGDIVEVTYNKADPIPNSVLTTPPVTAEYTFNFDNKPIVKGFNSDEVLVVLSSDIDYVYLVEEAKQYFYFTINGFRKDYIDLNGLSGTIKFYDTVEDIFSYTATGGETSISNAIPFEEDGGLLPTTNPAEIEVFYTPYLGTTVILTPITDYTIIGPTGTVNFISPAALASGDKVVVRYKRHLRPDDSVHAVYYINTTTDFLDIENINDLDGNNIVKTNARFPRDVFPSVVIEPFVPREGYPFVLDESYLSGDVSVGHDQMGIGAESLNQYFLSYSIPGGSYTTSEEMLVLPSISGWAWNGTIAEATGFDIVSAPGFGVQTGTYLNPGYYEMPISNADDHIFSWSMAVTGPTNLAASEVGVEIFYGSGGTKNRLVFHIGYDSLKVNDSLGNMVSSIPITSPTLTDYPIEGGCQNFFVVSISGPTVDFFVNGIKMLSPVPQSTGATAFVRFGKLSTLSVPVSVSWDYFRYLDGTSSVVDYTEVLGPY